MFDKTLTIIRQLSGVGNTLTIPRLYARFMGSLDGGLFLNQLVFWSDKGKRPDGFIYKARPEWTAETTLSDYALRKATKALKAKGLLETKVLKANGAPTLHYRLDLAALVEALTRFANNANGNVEINESDSSKSTNPGNVENDESLTDDYQTSVDSLIGVGVSSNVAQQLALTRDHDLVAGWVGYVTSQTGLKNPAGLVVARLRAGDPVPSVVPAGAGGGDPYQVEMCDGCGWSVAMCKCNQEAAVVVGRCPRCSVDVTNQDNRCPGCGEWLDRLPALLPVDDGQEVR